MNLNLLRTRRKALILAVDTPSDHTMGIFGRELRERPASPMPESQEPAPAPAPAREQENLPERPARNPVRSNRLVIAVDFGTTYSGKQSSLLQGAVNVATNRDLGIAITTTDAHHANLANIEVISDWGPRMSNLEKVPSVISYAQPRNGEKQWGTDISEGAVTMVN